MFLIREMLISPLTEEHIWTKHHVTPEEAEEACFSNPWVLRGREGSYVIYGQTEAGRYLAVFLYPRGEGVFSLATARDMDQAERRIYQAHRRR
jgi:uncharacterized protein